LDEKSDRHHRQGIDSRIMCMYSLLAKEMELVNEFLSAMNQIMTHEMTENERRGGSGILMSSSILHDDGSAGRKKIIL
jgi:hypothetical protein